MAGHSKRHNIKHRKAAQDSKKSKIYARVAKVIQMAAKNGDDPSLNPALDTALTKAKQAGLPKDVIQKAVDKGAWNIAGEELVEVFYEGYGPGWVALYIKCITSNTNRSASNVRAILTKYWGSLWAPGSVSWQFVEKGELFIEGTVHEKVIKRKEVIEKKSLDNDVFEMFLMETRAEDYSFDDWTARVITAREDFLTVLHTMEKNHWDVSESDFAWIAENEITLSERDEEKLQKLLDILEEDEDVDTIWHNAG